MNQSTGHQALERPEKIRYERADGFDPVRRGDKDDDRNRKGTEIRLVLQILIGRQHRVERCGSQPQQPAVSLAGPAHRRDSADIVLRQGNPGKSEAG